MGKMLTSMKIFILLSIASFAIYSSDVSDRVFCRNRIIEIFPASNETVATHCKNAMEEIGEGTTFCSVVPNLLCLHDLAKQAPAVRLVIDVANEEYEFSVRYPSLCALGTTASLGRYYYLDSLVSIARNICTENCKRYFDIVNKLAQYAVEYLPNARDKKDLKRLESRTINDARNPLLVSLELHDALGTSIGELFMGIFVSGNESCKLMLGTQVVTSKVVDKELHQFNIKLFENANALAFLT